MGGDAGGDGVGGGVDGEGVGCALGVGVGFDHLREVEAGAEIGGKRGADEAAGGEAC